MKRCAGGLTVSKTGWVLGLEPTAQVDFWWGSGSLRVEDGVDRLCFANVMMLGREVLSSKHMPSSGLIEVQWSWIAKVALISHSKH